MGHSSISYGMIFIYIINFLSVLTILYVERKKPISAVAWILVLILLPAVGFVFYFIFGRNLRPNQKRILKLKKEYDEHYNAWLTKEKHLIENKEIVFKDKSIERFMDMIEMNINASKSIYSDDNDITIFTSAQDKYEALLKDIEDATETIHLLYFIIKDDNIGRKIVNLLEQKARQGVQIRLVYDHFGSLLTPNKLFRQLKKAGGKVYRFFPLRFGTYFRINYRNHRKIAVIDGKYAYTGGINIGDEYMGYNKKISPWRDTHIRIEGTAVNFLQERFLKDWYYASREPGLNDGTLMKKLFPEAHSNGDIGVQVVSGGADSNGEQIKHAYIKMINSAREKILIQTPYFVPDDPFLESLQMAAQSGVDVRVMLPATPDKKFVYHATTSYIKDLLDYGIKVYLYPGFLHAKMLVADGNITSLGTTNIDMRSFMLNFEVNVFIYDTDFSHRCADIFEIDQSKCRIITKQTYESRGFTNKFLEGVSRLFSPLL